MSASLNSNPCSDCRLEKLSCNFIPLSTKSPVEVTHLLPAASVSYLGPNSKHLTLSCIMFAAEAFVMMVPSGLDALAQPALFSAVKSLGYASLQTNFAAIVSAWLVIGAASPRPSQDEESGEKEGNTFATPSELPGRLRLERVWRLSSMLSLILFAVQVLLLAVLVGEHCFNRISSLGERV